MGRSRAGSRHVGQLRRAGQPRLRSRRIGTTRREPRRGLEEALDRPHGQLGVDAVQDVLDANLGHGSPIQIRVEVPVGSEFVAPPTGQRIPRSTPPPARRRRNGALDLMGRPLPLLALSPPAPSPGQTAAFQAAFDNEDSSSSCAITPRSDLRPHAASSARVQVDKRPQAASPPRSLHLLTRCHLRHELYR
jgi:hypothetical protein